jgi:hypothetical protein
MISERALDALQHALKLKQKFFCLDDILRKVVQPKPMEAVRHKLLDLLPVVSHWASEFKDLCA